MPKKARQATDEAAERQQVGFRVRDAREAAGLGRDELAARLKVHPGSIARWESGGAVPQRYYLRQIAEMAQVSEAWLRYGTGDGPVTRREPRTDRDASPVSFDAISAFIRSIAEPGQERLRKLDALDAYRRLITTREALPGWWYDLKEMVQSGEL